MDFEVVEGLPSKVCKICSIPIETNSDFCEKCHKTQKLLYERNLYQKLREERLATGVCVSCGKNKVEAPLKRCNFCRKGAGTYKAAKRKTYILDGKCNNCGTTPVSETCKELCETCRLLALTRSREAAHKNKVTVMAHYGQSKCNCCGESELEFLTIDHIDGCGARHRRSISNFTELSGEKFYRWLIKNNFPSGYQVLCFNCNFGKYVNGECPHHATIKIPITRRQKRNAESKTKAMQAYGGGCACCPETLLLLLNIDHINGRTDRMRGAHLYRWLIKNNYPKEFQILCFNCNVSKYLSGRCVHSASSV